MKEKKELNALLVFDDPDEIIILEAILEKNISQARFNFQIVPDPFEALGLLETGEKKFDLIVAEYRGRAVDALDICHYSFSYSVEKAKLAILVRDWHSFFTELSRIGNRKIREELENLVLLEEEKYPKILNLARAAAGEE